MNRKKIFSISKNIIAFTTIICMMLYFGYAQKSMQAAYADLMQNEEVGTQQIEDVTATETKNPESEELSTEEQFVADDATSELEPKEEATDKTAPKEDTEGSTKTNVGENPEEITEENTTEIVEENTTENTTENTESAIEADTTEKSIVASICYTYSVEVEVPDETQEEVIEGLTDTTEEAEKGTENETENETEIEAKTEKTILQTEIRTETEEYETLGEAFAGAKAVTAKLEALGVMDYVPTICILQDISLSETVSNGENASFVLDLNGHRITLTKDANLNLGIGCITISDVAYHNVSVQKASGQETEDVKLGSIIGEGECLISEVGDLTVSNGYLENTKEGSIIQKAKKITLCSGYYLASKGRIVNQAETVAVTGGFYIYDIAQGFLGQGELILPERQVLVKKEILLGDVSLTGVMLGEPDYMVSMDIPGEIENIHLDAYYADFAGAWAEAVRLSSKYNQALATIQICREEIQGILTSQCYEMSKIEENPASVVELLDMKLKRAEGYYGSMFAVNCGKLILSGCTIDGATAEGTYADASLIRVADSAVLSLNNSKVQNNCCTKKEGESEPQAGIYLAKGAALELLGAAEVSENTLFRSEDESSDAVYVPQNVYMMEGSQITVGASPDFSDGKGHIGITQENEIVPGLTMIGKLDSTFLAERTQTTEEGQTIEISDVLAAFTSDEFPSYFLEYSEEKNALFWDKTTYYLPEAGELRMEFLLLFLGLAGAVLCNLPAMKTKRKTAYLVTGISIVCFLAGSVTGFWNLKQEQQRYYMNMQTLEQLALQTQDNQMLSLATVQGETVDMLEESESMMETESVEVQISVPEDGRTYYGIIEIPQLGIRLPVLEEYSDANMKTTPCVYYGDVSKEHLVIVGHNYESQFASFNELNDTVDVILTLMDGSVYTYESFAIEYLEPDQVDEMLGGMWDLTVFTCNYAGDKRIAVRCLEKE